MFVLIVQQCDLTREYCLSRAPLTETRSPELRLKTIECHSCSILSYSLVELQRCVKHDCFGGVRIYLLSSRAPVSVRGAPSAEIYRSHGVKTEDGNFQYTWTLQSLNCHLLPGLTIYSQELKRKAARGTQGIAQSGQSYLLLKYCNLVITHRNSQAKWERRLWL
ncbi:hypothetical protein BDV95DRAFT_387530 [Massariosphaeria phaeospora]|uniref:Uncharacterized protein n=1 Tax=Massariosphaeria phaeospora TaxID=100035 RepID=A0A7C8MM33_9PLEO|nr:hypothetical protein BDV95DRAFT_387530 [Massariosphaeria phaeospora]